LPFNDYHKTIQKPIIGYNESPSSLGDKIRNKRLELKLLQKDVANLIGVSEDAVTYWENNRAKPQIQYYPKVIEFLGYFPFKIDTSTLGDKLNEYRLKNGLSQKKVGKLLGVDESTICGWEGNENTPLEKHLKKLLELVK
jgi:transcriptional regulator with XRE-family HTH domain